MVDCLRKARIYFKKAILFASLFSLSSCNVFSINRHKPLIVHGVNSIFKDNNGNVYYDDLFVSDTVHRFNVTSNENHEFFEYCDANGEIWKSLAAAANASYFFVATKSSSSMMIKVFDKNIKEIVMVPINNGRVLDMTCKDETVYWIHFFTEESNRRYSLLSYNLLTGEKNVLIDSMEGNGSCYDGDTCIFYSDTYEIGIVTSKTKLIHATSFLLTNTIQLKFDEKTIIIKKASTEHIFKTNFDFNGAYRNAYLIDNKLVFATKKFEKNKECSFQNNNDCICKMQESFLFSFDVVTNELSLIKEYDPGTILLDYDLDGAQYYCDGKLYINDVFYRDCNHLKPGEIKKIGYFDYYRYSDDDLHTFISFFDGEFYGIQ